MNINKDIKILLKTRSTFSVALDMATYSNKSYIDVPFRIVSSKYKDLENVH